MLIVHSAVTGITDRLERLLDSALVRAHDDELRAIEERHHRLAAELGISIGDVEKHLQELRQIAAGVALVGEVSDRTRARVMATGELMATELGARFLRTQGLDVAWADARTMLRAEDRRSASAKASILSATCNFAPDIALEERLATLAPIVITQGFIASDDDGNTVLLGRGGLRYVGRLSGRETACRASGDLDGRTRNVQRQSALDAYRTPAAGACTTTKRRRSRPAARKCCILVAFCRHASTAFRCMSMPRRRRSWKARSSVPRVPTAARR